MCEGVCVCTRMVYESFELIFMTNIKSVKHTHTKHTHTVYIQTHTQTDMDTVTHTHYMQTYACKHAPN